MLSLVTAVHFADSLSEHHRYAEAVGHYQMALRQMKSASTLRQISGQMEEKGLTEMDVRMKLALCQCRMKNYQFALETVSWYLLALQWAFVKLNVDSNSIYYYNVYWILGRNSVIIAVKQPRMNSCEKHTVGYS